MCRLQAAGGATLKRAAIALAVGLGLFGFAADQLTKEIILASLQPGESVPMLGELLRFTLIFNPGAAFGLGRSATLAFTVFAIVALAGCLGYALPRVRRVSQAVVLGFFLAGISGNLHDRLFRPPAALYGHVVDFIQLPYFAIFNVADVFITLGAALLILFGFRSGRRPSGV
ncbi:signal peptidase II [Tessaracoccus sp. OH4464_COT-324]|uniref:signal peptidase II n=1 Tax=Tessaracoccus sp. OH4464_COT-324 TaxID=2491059 RepID=UPI003519B7A3